MSREVLTNNKPRRSHSALYEVIALGLFIVAVMLFMFVMESVLITINLINIIMTLGGLESYDQSVIGFCIIVFLFGITAIAFSRSPNPSSSHTSHKQKKKGKGRFQSKLERFFKV